MILDTLAGAARERTAEDKENVSEEEMRDRALGMGRGDFAFEKALGADGMSFICEVKKASPSKGVIAEDFPYVEIAVEYEGAGAAAISVLTEPKYFLGCDRYLTDIKSAATIPVLRKDFTVDSYQIYQAKTLGADAVLLICALLDTDTLREYIGVCDKLGISALVEAHTELEVHSALEAGARVVGVNNRDLKTFEVDISICERLRELVPYDRLFVAESGIKTPDDTERLNRAGVDAVLIGETLMRCSDRASALARLRPPFF